MLHDHDAVLGDNTFSTQALQVGNIRRLTSVRRVQEHDVEVFPFRGQ